MAGIVKLDGAGIQKMKTVEEALTQTARLHGLVETFGLTLKQNKPTSAYIQQIKRALPPLVGLLKPQFGLIADLVASMNLMATRGSSDPVRLRTLREGVGSLKQHLEIAMVRIKENHAVEDEPKRPV